MPQSSAALPDNSERLLDAALVAAYRAGDAVMKFYGGDNAVDTKGAENLAGDVVTAADHESQRIIVEALKNIHPDIGFLGEEGEEKTNRSRFEKPWFWCVDPLDGTLPFLEQSNGFAVSIALVTREGTPVMGVCRLPAFRDVYHAVAGRGAFRNGRPVRFDPEWTPGARVTLSLNPASVKTPERHAAVMAATDALARLDGVSKVDHHLHGGAVPKACWLFDQAPAVYLGVRRPGEGCSAWDLAASACVIAEAGGHVSNLDGGPIDLNPQDGVLSHAQGFLYASHARLAEAILST